MTSLEQNTHELTFEALMQRLEKIVKQLEQGNLPLEKSITLFEEGMGIAKRGIQKLDKAEQRVNLLLCEDGAEKRVTFDNGKEEKQN